MSGFFSFLGGTAFRLIFPELIGYFKARQEAKSAKTEAMKWVRGGGVVLRGLVLRRKAETALF